MSAKVPEKILANTFIGKRITITQSMNQFAFKLLKVFCSRHQSDSRNMCFSPLEVFNSYVMLLIGSKGITETQLEDMLCLKNFNNPKRYKELMELRKWIIKSICLSIIRTSFISDLFSAFVLHIR